MDISKKKAHYLILVSHLKIVFQFMKDNGLQVNITEKELCSQKIIRNMKEILNMVYLAVKEYYICKTKTFMQETLKMANKMVMEF